MKRLFRIFSLLICSGLMLSLPAYASARYLDRNALQREVAQLKKQLQEQAALAEQERYAHAEKIRALEMKCNQTDQPRKLNPYSYP